MSEPRIKKEVVDPTNAWEAWRRKIPPDLFVSKKEVFFAGFYAGAIAAIDEMRRLNDEKH